MGLRMSLLNDDDAIRLLTLDFVPVSVNLFDIRKDPGPGGELFRSVRKELDKYQGWWIISPQGKGVKIEPNLPAGRKYVEESLRVMREALKEWVPLEPRKATWTDPLPNRGKGVTPDGSVSLAIYSRLMHKGNPDGPTVIDTATLDAAEWASFAPPEGKVQARDWSLPESVAHKVACAIYPSESATRYRSQDFRQAEMRARLESVEGPKARIRLFGTWRAEGFSAGERDFPINATSTAEGLVGYDLEKKSMESFHLLFSGKCWDKVETKTRETGCVAEWAAIESTGIKAVREDENTVRVTVPGVFETTITKTKGFGHTWFDLKHDPEKKRDLAPILTEAGLLWTKLGIGENGRVGTSNPPKKMELLEEGPVRARVRLTGVMNRRGLGIPKEDLEELGFEQTFTIYSTGAVYVDYALLAQEDLPLHHFLLILKPNGAWGKNGKGEGAGEARCAGEHGPAKPSGATASSFALEWTNGPTHFQDILMVMNKGKYNGTYWDEGYLDKDLRCGLDVLSRWPDKKLPKGKDHLYLMMVFRDNLNGHEAARPVAEDYRSPDRLSVAKGVVEIGDDGDADRDGFNEAEGCYLLKSSGGGVAFTLHGASVPRLHPAFKIKGWAGPAPRTLTFGGTTLAAGKDFMVSHQGDQLVLQLLRVVREDVEVSVLKR